MRSAAVASCRLARRAGNQSVLAVRRITGRKPAIGELCCEGEGDSVITVVLGAGSVEFAQRPAPNGNLKVPAELPPLYSATSEPELAAVKRARLARTNHRGPADQRSRSARGGADPRPAIGSNAAERQIAADVLGFGRAANGRAAALLEDRARPRQHGPQ